MIDLLYNGILAALVFLWVLGVRGAYVGKIVAALKKYIVPVSVLFWVVFIGFAAVFLTDFGYFDGIHDIDEAVEAAVTNYDAGINPYEEYVVPRFKSKYTPNVDWELGPYNYLPLDLLVYHASYKLIGSLGDPVWFVVTNLLFSGLAFLLLRRMTDAAWVAYVPMAGTVMLFYSFDNASLTLLLMVVAIYAHERSPRYPEALGIVIMALAVMTKVYAAIPFVVLMLYDIQMAARARNWLKLGQVGAAVGVGAAIGVLLILPFGMSSVLDAAVFFHTSEELRVGTSCGGTLLSEVALGSEYYSMISAGLVFASLVVGLRFSSLNDRVLLTVVVFLLVAVKSSLAPLTVAGVFLVLRMKELADERRQTETGLDGRG